jgi:hypothetical protein
MKRKKKVGGQHLKKKEKREQHRVLSTSACVKDKKFGI